MKTHRRTRRFTPHAENESSRHFYVPDAKAVAAGAREPHNLIEVRYGLPSGPLYYDPHDYVPR